MNTRRMKEQNVKEPFAEKHNRDDEIRLNLLINKDDDDLLEELSIAAFKECLLKQPNTTRTLINEKRGYKFVYNKVNVVKIPLKDTTWADVKVLTEVARQLPDIVSEKYGWKWQKGYYAYIFKLLKEQHLGLGYETISQEDFVKMLKEEAIDVGSKQNISKYLPVGNEIKDWHHNNERIYKVNEDDKMRVIANLFVDLYNKLRSTGEG